MLRGYIYARCSTDKQDEASLEVQIRNCQEMAQREGILIPPENIYSDYAVSGMGHSIALRTDYRKLLDAWEAGIVDIVFANELSRLTRDDVDGALLKRRIEQSGVIVVTRDGIDTRRPNWHMAWGMMLTMSGQEVRMLATRVCDGMKGVLEGGGMIAAPPFGFIPDPMRKSVDDVTQGARWVLHSSNARIVQEMYEMRRIGHTQSAIALELNRRGIPSPRKGRDGLLALWREATVCRVLANKIYRGVFEYHGSAFVRAKLRKRRETPTTVEYLRPEFRLVSDEVWFACNPPKKQRIRGGVSHVLAGLVKCGDCGCKISWKRTPSGVGGNCPCCQQAIRVGARERIIGYTSIKAASIALGAVLKELISEEVTGELRGRLKAKLAAPQDSQEKVLGATIAGLRNRQQRLLRLAQNPDLGMETVESQLVEVTDELKRAERGLERIRCDQSRLKPSDVRAQLQVDIAPLLERLLAGEPTVHQARAVLNRLIKRFSFVGRPMRGVSVFEIVILPAAATAEAAGGVLLEDTELVYRVTSTASAFGAREWRVEVVRI